MPLQKMSTSAFDHLVHPYNLNISNITNVTSAFGGNSSNSSEEDSSVSEELILLNDIVGVWLTGLLCLFGLTGNVLSFLVLLRAHSRSPMFYVLRAVAVSDTVFLVGVFLTQTVVNLYTTTGTFHFLYMIRAYVQYCVWPITMMTQMSTVWLTVLVSIERYIAICFPLKAASLCTIPKVRRAVVIIYIISVLYNVPRFFEFYILDGETLYKTIIPGHDEVYRYLYSCVMYSILLFFSPLLILALLNVKLILALQRGKKQWEKLQFRQKKEHSLTVIPLSIVVVFFICGTPALVVNVIDSINPTIMMQPSFTVFIVVANLLVVLNSACNFIIYCMLGKKFRTKLKEMLRSRCSSYRAVYTMNTNVSDF